MGSSKQIQLARRISYTNIVDLHRNNRSYIIYDKIFIYSAQSDRHASSHTHIEGNNHLALHFLWNGILYTYHVYVLIQANRVCTE